jgi:ferrous iron transport protein B
MANVTTVPLRTPLFRGERRLRIALVGLPKAGKSTLFRAVSSAAPHMGELAGTHRRYAECTVQLGLDEASVIDVPSIRSLQHLPEDELAALKYLLWGDDRPPVSAHERSELPAPLAPPNVIMPVVDATSLEAHLELTIELARLGRPMVIALNMMGAALHKALYIDVGMLSRLR